MKNKNLKLSMITISSIILIGCGGGGGGGSDNNITQNSSSVGFINISNTPSLSRMGANTMNIEVKSLEVKHIAISKIGNSKAKYALEKGDSSIDELTQVGEADANLDNNNSAIDLQNGAFYHIKTDFKTNGTYPNGVFFTISLVSTDKDNPFTKTVHNQNVIISKEGEQSFESSVLIPTNIPSGKYILVSKLSDKALEKLSSQKKDIKQIPFIGAVYVNISSEELDRTTAILDINTTKYIDTPYNSKNIFFVKDILNKPSGNGKFLFSNIGTEDVKAVISAKLELENGELLDLRLLDPSDSTIKGQVVINLPHYSTAVADKKIKESYNIEPIRPNYELVHPNFVQNDKPKSEVTPTVSNDIKNVMTLHHVFIPYAGRGAFGEERYRVTLSYYLPKESYKTLVNISPDLSLKVDTQSLKGKVKWRVTFMDKKSTDELLNSPIDITKFKDMSIDIIHGGISLTPISLIDLLPKPIDAAVDMPDGTAYVFSGTECAKLDIKTGKVIGDWQEISDVFVGEKFFFFYIHSVPITATFRFGHRIYFFWKDKGKYSIYDLDKHEFISTHNNRDFSPILGTIENRTMSECIDTYLGTDKFDATFIDFSKHKPNYYFIVKDKFLELEYIENEIFKYNCTGGSLSDKGQWSSLAGKHITAVLPDHKGRGKTRFFINGFSSKIVLNKPNLFIDKHNGINQNLGDSDIVSLKFDAKYGLESRWFVPNVRGYASANLDFYIFGHKESLFKLSADAYSGINKIHPYLDDASLKTKSGTHIYASALGSVYIDKDMITEQTVTAKFSSTDPNQKTTMSNMKTTLYDGNIAHWNTKTTIFSARFPVGPVLLAVSGGIDGELTIKSPITLEPDGFNQSLVVSPSTEARVGVFADGGVDYELVKAGVEADVTLTDLKVDGELKAEFKTKESNIDFDINAKVGGEVDFIRAGLSFYAGTRTHIEWCSSWGIPYPCGLGWDTWDIPIYHTPWLYNENVTIFNKNLVHEEIPLD